METEKGSYFLSEIIKTLIVNFNYETTTIHANVSRMINDENERLIVVITSEHS